MLAALAVPLAGCSGGVGAGSDAAENEGTIGLALSAGDLTLSTVEYTITGPKSFSKTGTIDVTGSTKIAATIGGIPAGKGFSIALNATGADGTSCTGAATFDVIAGRTTSVDMRLQCHEPARTGAVDVRGVVNVCPTIVAVSALPSEVTVGGTIALRATAHDADGAPSPLSYHWAASSGRLSNAASRAPTFTCTSAGVATLTLTVSDGDSDPGCPATSSTTVQCTAAAPRGAASLRAVPYPEGTAFVLGALARFANPPPPEQLGGFDRTLALRLSQFPNSRAIAGRLVNRFFALSSKDQALHLPGVPDPISFQSTKIAKSQITQYAAIFSAPLTTSFGPVDVLPAEKPRADPPNRLDYTGLACGKPSAPGGDDLAIYHTLLTHTGNGATYAHASKSIPDTGSMAGPPAGGASSAGAGTIFSDELNMFVDPAFEIVSAALFDDGTLNEQRDDIDLLITTAATFAATIDTEDKMAALDTALKYTLSILYLSNPARWSLDAVGVHQLSAKDFDSMYDAAPQTTSGIPWKWKESLDPRGSDYTLFFNVPNLPAGTHNVRVTIERVSAQGTVTEDASTVGFVGHVGIFRPWETSVDGPSADRNFPKGNGEFNPNWTVQRKMLADFDNRARIRIELDEREPGPSPRTLTTGTGWAFDVCATYCGDDPDDIPTDTALCDTYGMYVGKCPPIQKTVDIDPTAGSQVLELEYDITTGAITGPVSGHAGDILVATGTNSKRNATVKFRIE
jgi:hypothetical protein